MSGRAKLLAGVAVALVALLFNGFVMHRRAAEKQRKRGEIRVFWMDHSFGADIDPNLGLRGLVSIRPLAVADFRAFTSAVQVRWLAIRDPNFSDEMLEHLAGGCVIRNLDIHGTRVTDRGLDYARMIGGLQSLDIHDTLITPEAEARFRRARPGVSVTYFRSRAAPAARPGDAPPADPPRVCQCCQAHRSTSGWPDRTLGRGLWRKEFTGRQGHTSSRR